MKQIILSLILASCVLAQDPNDAPTFSNLPAAGLLEADFHLLGVDLVPNANTQVAGKYLTILNAVADDLFNNTIHGTLVESPAGTFTYDPDGAGPLVAVVFTALTSTAIDTSAELRAIVTDETGTGAVVFAGGNIAAGTATTAAADNSSTLVATTAFVQTEISDIRIPLIIAASDETTDITTGVAKTTFRMPYAMTVTAVRLSANTASTSGTPTIDINETGVSILSTLLTLDVTERTSTTAAVPAVVSDAALADDAEMTIDVDVAGTGTKGIKVIIIGTKP